MRQEYTPNKPKRKHLCHELRLHLARLWNRRIERNDATLTLRSFAEQEGLDAETWRREYYRGGGTRPVFDRYRLHRWLYGRYDPEAAQEEAALAASQRGARQRLTKPIADEFRKLILEPDRHRSPYDALQCLRRRHPDRSLPCLRTLYYHVEAGDIGLTHDDLPYGSRRRRKAPKAHPARVVPGRRTLQDRPADANTPKEAGHLEMDTVVSGHGGRGGVLVLIDRHTRLYRTEKLRRVDQAEVLRALRRVRRSGRLGTVRSVTTDNGCEFLDQRALDRALGAPVYYTRACAAYEKGAVENANRMLRRWFPKGTDFSRLSPQRIHEVAERINQIHRASLGGLSAAEKAAEAPAA